MMNRVPKEQEETSTRPIAGDSGEKTTNDDDDVLDSDSDDEQEDKLKSIHALRGGGVKKKSGKKEDEPHHNSSKDGDEYDDDDDEEEEDDDKVVLEKLHVTHPSLRRYDEFSSFLTRSERAREKPDVPPSKESMARRRVTILVDCQQQPSVAAAAVCLPAVGITVYYDSEPMTADEIKALFMQPADFTRCDDDVDVTTIRWNKAQKGHYKWNDNENTIRGLEEFCTTKKDKKNKAKNSSRADIRYQHGQKVLAEVVRQKWLAKRNQPYDDEKIRQVSIAISEPDKQRARELAQQDQDDVVKMHNPKWKNKDSANNNNTKGSRSNTSTRKEKGKGLWSFLQKRMIK